MATATAAKALPTRVAQAPARPTVLYDGRCRLCVGSTNRIRALDHAQTFDLLQLQAPQVAARFPEISLASVLAEMHVVEPTGVIERGHEAIRAILARLPGLRWLGLFWLVPGFPLVARAGYGFVARHRYWFNRTVKCDGDVCGIHR